MCNPVVFYAASALVTLIAGAGEAKAQREAGKANQQIAENNATLANQSSRDALAQGARDQEQSTWRTRALLGQQKAQIAANGIDMDIGTPLDILGETAMFGAADRNAIAIDAARKAWGFQGEATNYRNQGAQEAYAGKTGAKATILKSLGTSLSYGAAAYGAKAKAS